ncbi:MAG: hypothetical protein WA869_21890, partial [Alloacidobacterium sp.]
MKVLQIVSFVGLLLPNLLAQTKGSSSQFPSYMGDVFDFATFTRFDATAPPKSLIYQSNGFMALQESGFGGQRIIVPVAGPTAPVNEGERLEALDIAAPIFEDESGQTFSLSDNTAKHSLTYFADRSVYRATFDNGLRVSLTIYPVYGKPAAVLRVVVHSPKRGRVTVQTRGLGFQIVPSSESRSLRYGDSKWPYRLLLAADSQAAVQNGRFQWELSAGGAATLIITLGGNEREAEMSLADLRSSPDLLDGETHRLWNEYLASVPLVAPAEPVRFTISALNKEETIAPQELVRSELWFWRGLLNTTCQVRYLTACPMMIADWNDFMGMWSNDGIAEAIAMAATNRRDLARAAILNWFRYAV